MSIGTHEEIMNQYHEPKYTKCYQESGIMLPGLIDCHNHFFYCALQNTKYFYDFGAKFENLGKDFEALWSDFTNHVKTI